MCHEFNAGQVSAGYASKIAAEQWGTLVEEAPTAVDAWFGETRNSGTQLAPPPEWPAMEAPIFMVDAALIGASHGQHDSITVVLAREPRLSGLVYDADA